MYICNTGNHIITRFAFAFSFAKFIRRVRVFLKCDFCGNAQKNFI